MPKFQKKNANENPIADVWPDEAQPVNADGFTEAEAAQNLPPSPLGVLPALETVFGADIAKGTEAPTTAPDVGVRFEAFKEDLFKVCYRHGFVLDATLATDVKVDKSRLKRSFQVGAALGRLELSK